MDIPSTTSPMTTQGAAGASKATKGLTRAQQALAVVGALALLGLLAAIGSQVAALFHGATPARVVETSAGPYALKVSLYKDPADAGYALPFAIAPASPVQGALSYTVTSIPGAGVDATPVNGSVGRDPSTPDGVTGTVEVTVRGPWTLRVAVDGPRGHGVADVPIMATAPPPLPYWFAWLLGLLPAAGIAWFFIAERRRPDGAGAAPVASPASGEA